MSYYGVGVLIVALYAIFAFAVILVPTQVKVDPAETAAIAKTCEAKGMVAQLEVGKGFIRVFCEDVKKQEK